MESKLSVIVPVYKVEDYLKQCLDSIIHQTFTNLEIILIDDGSPDRCGKICDEYAALDPRIEVIHKKNGGLSAARNDGLARATGEWVTFIDSDDWLDINFYEQLFSSMQKQSAENADVYCAGGYIREIEGKQVVYHSPNASFLYEGDIIKEYCMARAIVKKTIDGRGNWCLPWDKFYKREFLNENNLTYDATCRGWEDALFNFKVFDFARVVGGSTDIGYHYRLNPTSIGNNYNKEKPQVAYDYITKLHAYVDANQYDRGDILKQAVFAATIGTISVCCRSCYFNSNNPNDYKIVAGDIEALKEKPYFKAAIQEKDNRFLTGKQILLKEILRLPRVWPLKVGFVAYEHIFFKTYRSHWLQSN